MIIFLVVHLVKSVTYKFIGSWFNITSKLIKFSHLFLDYENLSFEYINNDGLFIITTRLNCIIIIRLNTIIIIVYFIIYNTINFSITIIIS